MYRSVTTYACILVLALTGLVRAESVPLVLNHQGRLLDANDQPLEGLHALTFGIYETPAGGAPLWTEGHAAVTVSEGLFTVLLGSLAPLSPDLFSPPSPPGTVERYLEVTVNGAVLSPRLRLASTPYSVSSSRVDGDVSTQPGELRLSGMSGSTTATIRSSQNPGSSGSEVVLVDGNGSTTGTIRAAVDSSGYSFSSTGTYKATSWISAVSATSSLSDVAGSKGVVTGVTPGQSSLSMHEGEVVSAMLSSDDDSTRLSLTSRRLAQPMTNEMVIALTPTRGLLSLDSDSDGDGHSDGRVRVRVTPTDAQGTGTAGIEVSTDRIGAGPRQSVSLDGSYGRASTRVASDLDRDGNPDVVVSARTDSAGALHELSMDTDDDGSPEQSISSAIVPTGAQHTINTKGTGAQNGRVFSSGSSSADDGVVRSFVWRQVPGPLGVLEVDREVAMSLDSGESALSVSNTDGARATITLGSGLGGSTTGTIRMVASPDSTIDVLDTDSDGDGVAESAIERKTRPTGGTWTMSGSTTGTIRMATSADSASSTLDLDSDNDGVSESSIEAKTRPTGGTWTMSGSTTGTIRMATSSDSASSTLDLDSDNDGVSESSIEAKTRPTGGTWTMSGSTTGTIRMATSPDSTLSVLDRDSDNDGVSEMRRVEEITAGGMLSGLYYDDDEDGIAEHSVECSTAGNGSMLTVGSHLTTSLDQLEISVKNDAPRMRFYKDGTNRMSMRPEVGLQLYDDLGTQTVQLSSVSGGHLIDVQGGAYCDGTNWVNASDAASKENFESVDGAELLDQIAELEISRWNYKGQEGVEHIGPTAQDFQKAFGVGADDKSISTIDPSGIALAAIKELQKQNRDLRGENAELREALKALSRKVDALVATR